MESEHTSKCKCSRDCDHHKGQLCSNNVRMLPARRIGGYGEYEESEPTTFSYCDECMNAVAKAVK